TLPAAERSRSHRSRSDIKLHTLTEGSFVIFQAVLVEHLLRHPIPLIGCVAHIAEVFNSDLAGEEAGCGKIAHGIEESDTLLQLWFGFFRKCDLVYHFDLLIAVAFY